MRAVPAAREPVDDPAVAAIVGWFADQPDLPVDRLEASWFTTLQGTNKRTIPVLLRLGEQHLHVHSLFLPAPDENRAELYAYLLRRNLRTHLLRFALSAEGDVLLTGLVPRVAVDRELLDTVLGQLLVNADETFNPALRLGFSAYIAREQAWREKVGAPRNPIT